MSLIVFEDEHLLVANKPSGWNTHAPSPFLGEGIYEWLKHRESRWAKLAIIHRLDKETSGLLVFGKTTEANRSLTQQFTTRAVKKTYVLLTDRSVPDGGMTIKSEIVRAGDKYISRPLGVGGDRAETRFKIASRCGSGFVVEAEPLTGRTHQIRVHAAQLGFPIMGDTLYGGTLAPRVYLHAWRLFFEHPATSERMVFECPAWGQEGMGLPGAPNVAEWETRLALREAIVDSEITDSYRLIHGASDAWPGVYIDKLGSYLLVQSEFELETEGVARLQQMAHQFRACGVYHKRLNRRVRTVCASESSPDLLFGEGAPERFTIRENGLRFELSFKEGYSVGLFLDQRDNRRRFLVNHIAAAFPLFPNLTHGAEVLNTFAYTCGFSLAAARVGVRTTSVDLSKKYLEWGKRNFALNGIDPAQHDFIYGDVLDWMRRLAKKKRSFDCIVLDPPTFSQSRTSGTWQAEKDYQMLVGAALPLLKTEGVLLASTNAAKFRPEEFLSTLGKAVTGSGRQVVQQHYVPQPPDFPIARAEPGYLKTAWLRIR